MLKRVFVTCCIVAVTAVAAQAQMPQTLSQINNQAMRAANGTNGPLGSFTLRGGAMFTPRGAGVAGVDFDMSSLSMGGGWFGRVDADVIFKANFGGVNTIIPVTFDQVSYTPGGGGHNLYHGFGVGAVFGGKARLDGKLIVGTQLSSKFGAEVNLHFTEKNTLLCAVARMHF